jgi:hypothetical protein
MAKKCDKCKGSSPFGFIIISIFFLIWIILSLGSFILMPLGILGGMMFRLLLNIPVIETSPWYYIFLSILQIGLDLIPIVGPCLNFLIFWRNGYF